MIAVPNEVETVRGSSSAGSNLSVCNVTADLARYQNKSEVCCCFIVGDKQNLPPQIITCFDINYKHLHPTYP